VTLSEYNRLKLGKQAKDLGFIRDTFEKVFRLTETMSFFEKDPVLSKALALKGGTAINLTLFNLPRLSVDIDLDYTQNTSRDAMMREREIITDSIKKYMAASSYILSEKSKYSHSLDSFVFAYNNAAGMKDNIKIEINYSLRCHVLPLEHRSIETLGVFRNTTILSIAPVEIYASKIVALLSRAASRDLYDINNMLYFNLFDDMQKNMLRKCVVFYSAIASTNVPETFDFNRIDSITKYKIRTDLYPVIRKKEKFELAAVQTQVKSYLTELLNLSDKEQQFLDSFRMKKYLPELLFDNEEILSRIHNHPMALWKMQQK